MARMNKFWTTDRPKENGFYWVRYKTHSSMDIINIDICDDGYAMWGDTNGGEYSTEWGHWEEYIECRSVEPIPPPGFKRGTFRGIPFLMKMKMADTDTDTDTDTDSNEG